MRNPFGGFSSLVQGVLGVVLAYYMLDLGANSADPGFPKMVAYNAGAWALLKGLGSVVEILVCSILNPMLQVFESGFQLSEQWCENFESMSMRLNYISTVIAGISSLIYLSMTDAMMDHCHIWAIVLVMRFFDFLFNVARVGNSKYRVSGVQNFVALAFIAAALGVFVWATDAANSDIVRLDEWFIGLSSAHIVILVVLLIAKGAFGDMLGVQRVVEGTTEVLSVTSRVEEGLTTLVFSVLYVMGSIVFARESAHRGELLFVLLSLFHADLCSRNPITDAGLDDDPSYGERATGKKNPEYISRIAHLIVGAGAVWFLAYRLDGGVEETEALFLWGGLTAASLKAFTSLIGMLYEGPMNVVKSLFERENELEVGLRRLSTWGLLVASSGLYALSGRCMPVECLKNVVDCTPQICDDRDWLVMITLVLGIVARVADYTLDTALANSGIGYKTVEAVLPIKQTPAPADELRCYGVVLLSTAALTCLALAFADKNGQNFDASSLEGFDNTVYWLMFIALLVHASVAVLALAANVWEPLTHLSLSRNEAVRTVVTTFVLTGFAWLIGTQFDLHREVLVVGIVMYTGVDVMGRNLL